MAAGAYKLIIVLNGSACHRGDVHAQRLYSKHQLTLSDRPLRSISAATDVTVRFRDATKNLVSDHRAKLLVQDSGRSLLFSDPLATELIRRATKEVLLFLHLEQANGVVRVTGHFTTLEEFEHFAQQRPELRLASYD